ncbi:restriction endonuclease [Chryseobacterium paludis]|uniref:restriction endonuclease n=1 Tax=Chryseobacterium paludis TaxID=2956784 RepID=UPI0021C01E46|nr:restriction endonuclease [Chryseobacterium paludis]
MKKWREYERLVSVLTLEEYGEEYTVIPNARIRGFISQRKRQIDVLVDYRFDSDLERRIIFDAKDRKRPIDIKEIESFEGLMKDVGAKIGFIICSNGFTKSALRRSQEHITIRLVPYNEIEAINIKSWDICRDYFCNEGLVLWDLTPGIIIDGIVYVQATGKCDTCGKFHIWCWSCGNRLCIEYESELQCACEGPWFWLTSIEDDHDESGEFYKSHYLLLVLGNGQYYTMDRRPI